MTFPRPDAPPPLPLSAAVAKHDETKSIAAAVGGAIAGLIFWAITRSLWWVTAPVWAKLLFVLVIGAALPAALVYFAPRNKLKLG